MRKIAAKAGITAGAIYKHFSGKEEMFDELFEASAQKLMGITESMMDIDFSSMADDELIGILYSRVSIRTIQMLEGDIRLLHMLLKNDTGKCLKKCRIAAKFPKRIAEIDRKNQNSSLQHQTTGV